MEPSQSDQKPEHTVPPFDARLNLLVGIFVVIVGAIWVVLYADRVMLPLIAKSGVQITIPDLRNLHFETADSICSHAGLELVRGRTRTDEKLPPGVILDQFPAAGSIAKPGRRIEATISDAAGLVACPSFLGRSPREAGIIADSIGLVFRPERVRYATSAVDPEGVIISQQPPPFSGMLKGAEVRLTVSLGEAPAKSEVPNLVGRNIEQVRMTLAKYGLGLGEVSNYPSRGTLPGTILSQAPGGGSAVPESGTVDVVVAMAPLGEGGEVTDTLSRLGMPIDTTLKGH